MACIEKKADVSKTRNKDGRVITTKTRRVMCGDRTEDLQEDRGVEHLEEWENLVYPEALKQKPVMIDVVVEDTRTGQRYTKPVPAWALEKLPDPDLIKQHLVPDEEQNLVKEVFKRFL